MPVAALDLFFWSVALAWWLYTAVTLTSLAAVPRLPGRSTRHATNSAPRVAVVVPARNEQARIETTVARLLEQSGVELEVVVVDDRSTDRTGEILARLAAADPRVNVVRVETLPPDWLGKTHACRLGALRSTADWLLFTDADVWLARDVISRAVAAAVDSGADHVCLLPGETRTTLPARAALLGFFNGMAFFAARANRDRRRSFVGVGAFNLVRGEAYRAIGGHAALKLEILDDLKLGLLLRRSGRRSRAYLAGADVEVSWAPTVGSMLRVLEKNLFALFGFRPTPAVLALAVGGILLLGANLAPFAGRLSALLAFAGFGATSLPALISARRAGWGVAPALLSPWMNGVMLAALGRSLFAAMRQKGIVWRGTFYPLDRLRRGQVRF